LNCAPGASDSSFPVIVAAVPTSSLPHYRPGETLVQADNAFFSTGARLQGILQRSDANDDDRRVSSRMKESTKSCWKRSCGNIIPAPGVTTKQADTVARDIIDKAGFKEQFGHDWATASAGRFTSADHAKNRRTEEELRPGMSSRGAGIYCLVRAASASRMMC